MQNSAGSVTVLDVELDPDIAPRQARWLLHDVLAGEFNVPFLNDVLLATSEVVTNALLYAPGPYRLTVRRDERSTRLRIGVSDGSAEVPLPAARGSALDLSAGRGLRIVDMVSSDWGVTVNEGGAAGKEVWFEMVSGHLH
jgi:hypothetical protein